MRVLFELWRMWWSRWSDGRVQRVLLIQTADTDSFLHLADTIRGRFRNADIDIGVLPRAEAQVPENLGCHVIAMGDGVTADLVRQLRKQRYDTAVVGMCGESGFWRQKILGFLVGARQVLFYNENGDGFPCNLFHLGAMHRHFWWRRMSDTRAPSASRRSYVLGFAHRVFSIPVVAWLLVRAGTWELRRRFNRWRRVRSDILGGR